MNNSSLTHFFKLELEKVGYRDLKPSWSLGYCQGDGVAFYGVVRDTGDLVARLMPELSAEEQSVLAGSVYLKITSNTHRYSHANTMNVDAYPDDVEDGPHVETLVDRVLEDVRSQSRRLEAAGYKILEAVGGETWEGAPDRPRTRIYKRGEFVVLAQVLPAEDLDLYESGEDEDDHLDALRMVAGELIAYDVLVTVRWRNRDLVKARSHGVIDKLGELSFKSIALNLVRECRHEIDELRTALRHK